MKLVNRGFLVVRPKQPFFDWANTFESDFEFNFDTCDEPNSYLVTEDFLEIEPLIEQHYKQIFCNELSMITEKSDDWPAKRTFTDFLNWFDIEVGSTVFDLEKSDIRAEFIE
jgi:hypothetical protein